MIIHSFSPQEKKLFKLVQNNFPLVKKPFDELGKKTGLSENEVISILTSWKEKGILRQISAIFEPSFFGHKSALFAFKVPNSYLKIAKEVINNHPGVSHNYLRNNEYQLWFVLVVPPGKDLLEEAKFLAKRSKVSDMLYLPIIKTYKISTTFGIPSGEIHLINPKKNFSLKDIQIVKALQEPLSLSSEPFSIIAKNLNINEEDIFNWIKEKKQIGALRRFGALIKPNKIGLKFNLLIAWEVKDPIKKEKLGRFLSQQSFVSHCYERKSYKHWPFNIYCMCHFSKSDEIQIINKIAQRFKIENYVILETLEELKKIRLKLFYC